MLSTLGKDRLSWEYICNFSTYHCFVSPVQDRSGLGVTLNLSMGHLWKSLIGNTFKVLIPSSPPGLSVLHSSWDFTISSIKSPTSSPFLLVDMPHRGCRASPANTFQSLYSICFYSIFTQSAKTPSSCIDVTKIRVLSKSLLSPWVCSLKSYLSSYIIGFTRIIRYAATTWQKIKQTSIQTPTLIMIKIKMFNMSDH